jgi:hypothetical protein
MADTFDTFQKGRPNLFIACPAYGGEVKTEFMMACIQLSQTLMQQNIGCKFGSLSFPDIEQVRNIFTSIFYDRTPLATHCLMMDSDMNPPPELIIDMLNSEHPLVGIIPVKKKFPLEFVGRGNLIESEPVNGYMQVDGCGAGIVMFQREVISEMLLKIPDVVDPYPIDKHPASELILAQGLTRLLRPWQPIVNMEIGRLSEDLSFCRRWKYGCGGEVWANILHAVGHIGNYEFRARYLDLIEARKAAEAEAKAKVAAEAALKEAAE